MGEVISSRVTTRLIWGTGGKKGFTAPRKRLCDRIASPWESISLLGHARRIDYIERLDAVGMACLVGNKHSWNLTMPPKSSAAILASEPTDKSCLGVRFGAAPTIKLDTHDHSNNSEASRPECSS